MEVDSFPNSEEEYQRLLKTLFLANVVKADVNRADKPHSRSQLGQRLIELYHLVEESTKECDDLNSDMIGKVYCLEQIKLKTSEAHTYWPFPLL